MAGFFRIFLADFDQKETKETERKRSGIARIPLISSFVAFVSFCSQYCPHPASVEKSGSALRGMGQRRHVQ
jgi:hypothetical protein